MELTLIHKEDVPGNSNTIHDQLYLNLKYLLQLIIAKVLLLEVAGLVFILSDTAASDVVHAVLCYVFFWYSGKSQTKIKIKMGIIRSIHSSSTCNILEVTRKTTRNQIKSTFPIVACKRWVGQRVPRHWASISGGHPIEG